MKLRTLITICFFLLASVCLNNCSEDKQGEYITIGVLLPLTGEASDEGLRSLNGLQLAKHEINENGGIMGKKLDIIALNDRGDKDYVVQQYNILKEKGVVAIIGSSYSGVTIALAKAAEEDGMPIISPTASNPLVTKGHKNVFRAIFIDDYQAEAMAKFAYNSLNAKTALVLYDYGNDGSYKQIAEFFTKTFVHYGGSIIATEAIANNDYKSILKKYKENPPDIIYYPDDYVPAANLVNAVSKLNFNNTKVLGPDAWDGILAYVYNPEAREKVYYTSPFSLDDKDPAVAQFVKNYFNDFSQMPVSGSATSYTCVYILSEAIKKAGTTDKDAIISAIKESEFDMITGRIKFDEDNNPRTNVYITQIKDGAYSTYEKLSL